MNPRELDRWHDVLSGVVAQCAVLDRVHVIDEAGSTQDEARELGPRAGDVVVVGRQLNGRGRRGRPWIDETGECATVSFALRDENGLRPAIAMAVAAARCVQSLVEQRVGIKWPNDIMVEGRKIGGILVERGAGALVVGIGINVGHLAFPGVLGRRAVSVRLLGSGASRLDVIARLIREVDAAATLSSDDAVRAFVERDVLTGYRVTLKDADRGAVEGRLARLEPLECLVVRLDDGSERVLDVSTASIVRIHDTLDG